VTKGSRARVGVVAADAMRSIGLLAILEDTVGVEALPMDTSDTYETEGLDALLLDSRAPIDELSEIIARIRRDRPSVKVVVMGAPLDPDHVQAVIGAGAKGYLAETAGEGEIRMAMDVVLDGSIWAPRKVLARLIDAGGLGFGGAASSADSVVGLMTPRELEVLHLLMDGRTNRDIAAAMGIDEVTVKAHLGRMLRKTRSSNRVELTLRAIEERANRSQLPRTANAKA
jgi:DNA-binding NarL/FixJ family response regulator